MKFLEIKVMYEILFSKKALDFVETLQESYKEKIRDALTDFKENPFSHPYRKIRGKNNVYRIRVGKYRILYRIDEDRKIITVLKIDKRSRIYK